MPLLKLASQMLALPRPAKRLVAMAVDVSLCVLTVWLAFFLRLEMWIPLSGEDFFQPRWAALVSVLIAIPLFIRHGFYRVIFRYSELTAIAYVVRAFALYGLFYVTIVTVIGLPGVPRSVGLMQPLLLLLGVGGSRALARFWLGGMYATIFRKMNVPKALIYGAGRAGRELAMATAHSQEIHVVGFLDDDTHLQGHVLQGLPIHSPADLLDLVARHGIRSVLLAIPSASRQRRNEILATLGKVHVKVHTLPSIVDMAHGRVTLSDVHELDIDDLLGRAPVAPNQTLLGQNIAGKTVLVTGAGGSIGSELCRQILAIGPSRLLLVEVSEFALYAIYHELEDKLVGKVIQLIPLLASVQDSHRMHEIMSTWHPDTVYHAAAYKHVPLVEHNPSEGIRNNVLGTLRTAQAAVNNGVGSFVLISTDKAVRPTNIMGASKRLAEMVLQALAEENQDQGKTLFSMVRFGNVLDSSGSVVPKFRQQIRDGGPVTVTHPEVNRYFMTIPEAAQLVIQAGAMAKGGDVFVLNMGQPIKIMALAQRMIELSGLSIRDADNPDGDIEIEITGLRPGEKLFEELLIGDDAQPTQHPGIMKAHEAFLTWQALRGPLSLLEDPLQLRDANLARELLQTLVTGYCASEEIVDWVFMARDNQRGQPLH